MALRVLAYECKYCGTLKKTRALIVRHELACVNNPKAKNCTKCVHIQKTGARRPICGVSGKLCSTAVSARCKDFQRREDAEKGVSNCE